MFIIYDLKIILLRFRSIFKETKNNFNNNLVDNILNDCFGKNVTTSKLCG